MGARYGAAVAVTTREPTLVETWFGSDYARLHPQLQHLHDRDGVLRGPVEVRVASGIGRVFGERLRQRLGLPLPGPGHVLEVRVGHAAEHMRWERRFDGSTAFASHFIPVGSFLDGYWRETSGALELHLAVHLDDEGGWHWCTQRVRWRGLPFPKWLLPRVVAHKRWQHDAYDFSVSVRVPGFGEVVGYSGRLLPIAADVVHDA
jgi:hypothetical protein